jgi:hypothetical protein
LDTFKVYIFKHVVFDDNLFSTKDKCHISPYNDSKMLTSLFPISYAILISLNSEDKYTT